MYRYVLMVVFLGLGLRGVGQGLKIGDRLPAVVLGVGLDGKEVRFADMKGDLVVLDFWATWCAPCVAMLPKMAALEGEFKGRLRFLPVAYQSAAEIGAFRRKRGMVAGVEIVGDKLLSGWFPHTYLPHYVWLNRDGVVLAVTEYGAVTSANVAKLLGSGGALAEKRDEVLQVYDNHKPLLVNGNGTGGLVTYHSLLTGYVEGLMGGVTRYPLDPVAGLKITLRNVPLSWLLRTAYGEGKTFYGPNRQVLEVRDSSKLRSDLEGMAYLDWLKRGNGWCYELLVPPALAGSAYALMQRELSLLFPQYKVGVEKRERECWVLSRVGGVALATAGGKPRSVFNGGGFTLQNAGLNNIIAQLNGIWLQDSPLPIVDGTGFTGKADMVVAANLSVVGSLNSGLAVYGLALVKKRVPIDMLVIRDN
jgi:thiol-disulfide isomerase/thioredoxin